MDLTKITYQRLETRHLKDVQYLFWEVFRKKVTIEYLTKKYDTSHLGVQFICSIAYDGQHPIAFYGALPQLFTSEKATFLVAHACDSFTLKNYQGKGIHYQLALHSYDIMKAYKIKMVYAFHSENTFHSTKKLSWLSHQHMQRFHIKINTLPKAKIYQKLGYNDALQKNVATAFGPFDDSKNICFTSRSIYHQSYSIDYLNYKNGFHPHYFIRLEECQFLIKVDAIMHIGFFNYSSIENFEKALEQLKKIGKKIGVNELLFQISANSQMAEVLKNFIKPQQSWLIGYLPFEEVELSQFEFTFADLDTY